MAVKRKYDKWYWATEQPIRKRKIVIRHQEIHSGAGTKGAFIGNLGPPTRLEVDWNERDLGWVRIIKVDGHDPVPHVWAEQQDGDESNWEWWIDQTALMDESTNPNVIEFTIDFPNARARRIILDDQGVDTIIRL